MEMEIKYHVWYMNALDVLYLSTYKREACLAEVFPLQTVTTIS